MRRPSLPTVLIVLIAAGCDVGSTTSPLEPAFAPGGQGPDGRLPVVVDIVDLAVPGLRSDGLGPYIDQVCGVYAWSEDGLSLMHPDAAKIARGDRDACGEGRFATGSLDGIDQDIASIKLRVDDWDDPTRATAVINVRQSCAFTRGPKTTGKGLRFDAIGFAGSTDVFVEKSGASMRFFTRNPDPTGPHRNQGWCEDDHPESPRIVEFDFDVTVTLFQ